MMLTLNCTTENSGGQVMENHHTNPYRCVQAAFPEERFFHYSPNEHRELMSGQEALACTHSPLKESPHLDPRQVAMKKQEKIAALFESQERRADAL